MVREGDSTPYNMLVENCTVNECWSEVMQQACYEQRLADVTAFNRSEQCARAELCNFVVCAVKQKRQHFRNVHATRS